MNPVRTGSGDSEAPRASALGASHIWRRVAILCGEARALPASTATSMCRVPEESCASSAHDGSLWLSSSLALCEWQVSLRNQKSAVFGIPSAPITPAVVHCTKDAIWRARAPQERKTPRLAVPTLRLATDTTKVCTKAGVGIELADPIKSKILLERSPAGEQAQVAAPRSYDAFARARILRDSPVVSEKSIPLYRYELPPI